MVSVSLYPPFQNLTTNSTTLLSPNQTANANSTTTNIKTNTTPFRPTNMPIPTLHLQPRASIPNTTAAASRPPRADPNSNAKNVILVIAGVVVAVVVAICLWAWMTRRFCRGCLERERKGVRKGWVRGVERGRVVELRGREGRRERRGEGSGEREKGGRREQRRDGRGRAGRKEREWVGRREREELRQRDLEDGGLERFDELSGREVEMRDWI